MAWIETNRVMARGERRADDSWLFTIRYAVHFDASELGQRFDDSIAISDTEEQHRSSYAMPVAFTACSPSVYRKKRVVVSAGQLDRNAARDALFAWILLRRNGESHRREDEKRAPVTVGTV